MQEQNKPVYAYPQEEEFFFRQLLKKRYKDLIYLWQYRIKIGIACIIGAIFGVILTWWWPVSYTSRLTFVVEESKSGGGSLASALAGQFGFDIGNLAATSGVLAGDNVEAFLQSHKMIKIALLSPYSGNSGYSLADRYAESNNLKKKWAKYVKKGQDIRFPTRDSTYTRLQDSLVNEMIQKIIEEDLSVGKPDKKLSFFEVNITMRDEKLSQLFCTRLIQAATDFYIQNKTRKLRTNVNRLQVRADSITGVLNRKTYSASAANQILLDANPAYPTSNVGPQVQERDKNVLSIIYSEVIKNLEVSRTMLIQETPTFQIVDEPELPLKKNRLHYLATTLICMAIASAIYALYLLTFKKK